mmetsp:Transcript_12994/g.32802  ORF Transcript_12994/g.32802 Transcript_12994/m.32802 type:complete len:154 (+) Transcript_12994:180-641(+)
MESLSGMLIPIGTILLVVLLQISFWFPTADNKRQATTSATTQKSKFENTQQSETVVVVPKKNSTTIPKRITTKDLSENVDTFQCVFIQPNAETKEPIKIRNGLIQREDASQQQAPKIWKCACELGFLPAGIFKTFGNAEAMMRLGVGQCYHKK